MEVYAGDILVPNYKANVRVTDNTVLGMVSDRYQIVQNVDAFDFTDSLIGEECVYETAGSLDNGKRVWMLARMPKQTIVGDEVVPYLCFTNGHDGSHGIETVITPVRVVCQNTLNLALQNTNRHWKTRHVGNLQSKLEEARHTLELSKAYMENLSTTTEKLAEVKVSEDEVRNLLNNIYPVTDDDTDRKKQNMQDMQDGFMVCMIAPDILKFKGTAWGAINAAADWTQHSQPKRLTDTYQEKNFKKVLDGNTVLDTVTNYMMNKVKNKFMVQV